MTLRRIEKSQWTLFCQLLDKELPGKRAEIELASQEFGVQIEARWLPVVGVAYDPRNDVFEIALDGLAHLVFHPLELYAEVGSHGIESLAIVDTNTWQIVMLRDPLMLPPPAALPG
jgi:hypothetical protein